MNLLTGDRANTAAGASFVAATAVAWVGLAGYEPPMGLAGFLAGWTLAVGAMMLPAVAPPALLYRGSRAVGLLTYTLLCRLVSIVAKEDSGRA